MPHVIIKPAAGRTEPLKQKLAEAVTSLGEESVSVSLEAFASSERTEEVYLLDIIDGPGRLHMRPGYEPS